MDNQISYIGVTDIMTIINNYKDNKGIIYDVQFGKIASAVYEFIISVLEKGYWHKDTQSILKGRTK